MSGTGTGSQVKDMLDRNTNEAGGYQKSRNISGGQGLGTSQQPGGMTGGSTGMTGGSTGMGGGSTGMGTGMTGGSTGMTGGMVNAVGEVIDSKTFTKTEDHEVLLEKKAYELQHRPVEKEFVVETKYVGEQRVPGRPSELVGTEERQVEERVVEAPAGDRAIVVENVDVPLSATQQTSTSGMRGTSGSGMTSTTGTGTTGSGVTGAGAGANRI